MKRIEKKERTTKGEWHRDGRNPAFRKSFDRNAGKLFGESPNLRKTIDERIRSTES